MGKFRSHASQQPIKYSRLQTRILLVDDDDMGRQMARVLLEHIGVQVIEAENGIEAVAKVESEDFDLVLMDIQMPVMDGLVAATTIRTLDKPGSKDLPIIAMTAYAFEEHQKERLAAGMNGYITKPIELEPLYCELQRWLPADKLCLNGAQPCIEVSEHADLVVALPGVDVVAGLRRVVGNHKVYLELLKKFVEQFADMDHELYKEIAAGQQKEAIRRTHTLKAVAGGLGATHLQYLAGQLESQLTRQEISLSLPEVLQESRRLLVAISSLLELNRPEQDREQPPGTPAELRDILRQLLESLTMLQAQPARQQFLRLTAKPWPEEYTDNLRQLENLGRQYQFGPAADLVETLLAAMEC